MRNIWIVVARARARLAAAAIVSLVVLPGPIASAQTWSAPASADRRANPLGDEGSNVGAELYRGNCLPCHGALGKGDGPAGAYLQPKAADLTTRAVHSQSDGALFWKIRNGRTPMPAFKATLDERDTWGLVNYLRSLASPAARSAIPAPVAVVPKQPAAARAVSKRTWPDPVASRERGVPAAGASGGPGDSASSMVSREEYDALRRELEAVRQRLDAMAAADLPGRAEQVEERLEVVESDLGQAAAAVDSQRDGTHYFHASGYGFLNFFDAESGSSDFSAGFNPIFMWSIGDRLLVHAELEMGLEDGETEVELEYLDMNYDLSDFVTVKAGKFLTPMTKFTEDLHPTWINRLPDAPLFASRGLVPFSSLGVQLRGAIPIGRQSKLGWSVYASNGPELVTELAELDEGDDHEDEGEGDDHGDEGDEGDDHGDEGDEGADHDDAGDDHDDEGTGIAPGGGHHGGGGLGGLNWRNYDDFNQNKAFGGRLEFQPLPWIELGYAVQTAEVGPVGSNIDSLLQAVDLSIAKESPRLKGRLDVQLAYVWLEIDDYDFKDILLDDFENEQSGGYAQVAYRPSLVQALDNWEWVLRYDWIDQPESAAAEFGFFDEERWTFGVSYWISPSVVVKAAYQWDDRKDGFVDDDRFMFQFSYGF